MAPRIKRCLMRVVAGRDGNIPGCENVRLHRHSAAPTFIVDILHSYISTIGAVKFRRSTQVYVQFPPLLYLSILQNAQTRFHYIASSAGKRTRLAPRTRIGDKVPPQDCEAPEITGPSALNALPTVSNFGHL